MSTAPRNKSSRIIIVKNEAEFYGSIEKRLRHQGYILLEMVPKVCIKSRSKKKPSFDL
jgi:hypothetical protein